MKLKTYNCIHCGSPLQLTDSMRTQCEECGWINDLDFEEFSSISSDIPIWVLPDPLGPYLKKHLGEAHVAWAPIGTQQLKKLPEDQAEDLKQLWAKQHPTTSEKGQRFELLQILKGNHTQHHTLTLINLTFQKGFRGHQLSLPAQIYHHVEGIQDQEFFSVKLFEGKNKIEHFPRAKLQKYAKKTPVFLLHPVQKIDKNKIYRAIIAWD